VEIKSVGIRNFLIISEVDAVLSGRGLTRIAGENLDDTTSSSNGSGKSCILEAVYWCLFGDTLRNIKSADGVVNNNVKKNCSVVVQMSEGDTKYRVERYRKHSKKKNNLYLYVNDVDSRGKDNRETQEFIESVIGMDKVSFANSIIFGQGHSKNLKRFSEMGDAEKKATIERVLDIEAFAKAQEVAKARMSSVKAKDDVISAELGVVLGTKARLMGVLASQREAVQKRQELDAEKREKLSKTISEVLEKISQMKSKLSEMPPDVDVSELHAHIEQCNELEKSEKLKTDKLTKRYRERRDSLVSRRGMIGGAVSSFKARIGAMSDGGDAGESCQHCGAVITVENIDDHKDYLEFEMKDNARSLKSLDDEIADLSSSYEQKKKSIDESIEMARGLYKQFTGQVMRQDKISAERQSLENSIPANENLVESLRKQLEETGESTEVLMDSVARHESELEDCEKTISKITKDKEKIAVDLEYLEFWIKGFSRGGIRSFMLDKVVPFINERLSHYLTILTDGGITARFNTVKQISSGEYREDFNLEILNKNAADTYEGNSGGERRRVDLAVALAFNDFISSRSGKRFNILLLDEVFEGVDAEGLYYVIKVLEDLARRKSSVFVITHRDELKSYFNDEILVQRKDGMSILV
jgi:DNA repair exonuclease SbcCD ATPase subunit